VVSAGVSFVICTRNGGSRLTPTLEHLVAQRFRKEVAREVLLVDNASTDDTCEVARRVFAASTEARLPLRITHEPRPGNAYARARGLREAAFDYVIFVDDDNWLVPDFGQIAFDSMEEDRTIGILPAGSEAVFAAPEPPWFTAWRGAFAVGRQFAHAGDVSNASVAWRTAGLTVRRAAWRDLVDNGFAPWLKSREGGSLGGGEDTELCLALLLAGWRAHYDPRLSFAHWMPADRLEWRYACKLAYQGRAPNPVLAAYRRVLAERLGRGGAAGQPPTWKAGLAHEIVRAAYHVPRSIVWWMRGASFRLASLSVVSSLGGVVATRRFGQRYDALLAGLRGARWIGDGPARVARAGARSTAAGRGTGATL
jgi:GT2 family glycosyltransferase